MKWNGINEGLEAPTRHDDERSARGKLNDIRANREMK